MTEPQGPAPAGGGRLRASHADREQVIEALKNAFMQGRLTGEELGARTGQVLAARTYAELDAVTADIPGGAEVAGPPGLARRWPLARASVKSGCFLAIAAVFVQSGNIIANGLDYGAAANGYRDWIRVLNLLALALVVTALVILGRGVAASVKRRTSRKQLPPRPRLGAGHDPGPRTDQTRTDPTRTDLRTHISRGLRPVSDAT
jgi:Domain of unknown function (DUF1707)